MTKEFENFKNILGQKQNELDIQVRNAQKAKEDEAARKQAEDRQKQIESNQRAAENKRILENLGIVRLFEEIRDSGLVKFKYDPTYKTERKPVNHYKNTFFGGKKIIGTWAEDTEVKVSDFEPAKIAFGTENESISLQFNERTWNQGDNQYPSYCRNWQEITFYSTTNNTLEMGNILCSCQRTGDYDFESEKRVKAEIKIEKISEYIAEQISQTLNKK